MCTLSLSYEALTLHSAARGEGWSFFRFEVKLTLAFYKVNSMFIHNLMLAIGYFTDNIIC